MMSYLIEIYLQNSFNWFYPISTQVQLLVCNISFLKSIWTISKYNPVIISDKLCKFDFGRDCIIDGVIVYDNVKK